MVAQTQKIQALENQLDTVQYDQQANGARSIVPSVLGRVPATINTGVTAPVPARAPVLSGKKNNKKKFGANYIENDIPNGERSKWQYPNSPRNCSSHGYDIEPGHHSGNCNNWLDDHNELANITNMLGAVTTNCFYHKLWCWELNINKISQNETKIDNWT